MSLIWGDVLSRFRRQRSEPALRCLSFFHARLHPSHVQYRPQMAYSSLVPRNLKSTSTTSSKPSLILGSLKRDLNPLNAMPGNTSRASGFMGLFRARTTSLCWQSSKGVLNHTQRIGTLCFLANSIHSARPSTSGFVLSAARVLE